MAHARCVLGVLPTTLVLLLLITAVLGCGSSATTSADEAKAVSIAEKKFVAEWGHANVIGTTQCSKEEGEAGARCYQEAIAPLQAKAREEFSGSIKRLLEGGVGPECADELKETLSTMNSVPVFPGGTASICLSESRE